MESKKYEGYYVVRANGAGVFAGNIASKNADEVTMTNARQLYYWSGALNVMELAKTGVKFPQNCKFTAEVDEIVITNVLQIVKATKEAEDNLKAVKAWKA